MDAQRYRHVSGSISSKNDAIKERIDAKRQNTKEVIMLLSEQIEYFKYISADIIMLKRYEHILDFLKSNFGEFDELPVKKYLAKNGIFTSSLLSKVTSICYFISIFLLCILISSILKQYIDNMGLRIFITIISSSVLGVIVLAICGSITTSKFKPYKIHKDYLC